ncbi:MAG: hypothetical protein ABIV39_14515 [Verrucomicrobiota bacterium]
MDQYLERVLLAALPPKGLVGDHPLATGVETTLAKPVQKKYAFTVTTAEIKASIDKLTDEERFFAAAYLQHCGQVRELSYQTMLDERMNRMDAGKKVTLEQVQRVHQTLESEGL